jgi:pseudaminic acid cytidylyltransferase
MTSERLQVTRNAVTELWSSKAPDFVCCIYATAPLMDIFDLRRGYYAVQVQGVSHAISIGYPPLRDAAQFYWSRTSSLLAGIEYFDFRTTLIDIKAERICDINTEDDWLRAEKMYAALQEAK